jgi:hypothetical protein
MPMTEESFAAAAAADNVEDAARWLALDHGQRLRTVRRYMQALSLGREAAERFPEADPFYKKNVVPAGAYVSPGLRGRIEQGIKAFPARSRGGYAQDLFTMSRFAAGPESPCGWAPFCCGIDDKMQGPDRGPVSDGRERPPAGPHAVRHAGRGVSLRHRRA